MHCKRLNKVVLPPATVPRCAVCGRDVNFKNVSYIKEDVFVCRECFPQYYVKNLCRVLARRLRGESPLACNFCAYRKLCDEHVTRVFKAVS
jgi:recombinational DNA repair protein (RecF pathway)